jgi:hypothetical protein
MNGRKIKPTLQKTGNVALMWTCRKNEAKKWGKKQLIMDTKRGTWNGETKNELTVVIMH